MRNIPYWLNIGSILHQYGCATRHTIYEGDLPRQVAKEKRSGSRKNESRELQVSWPIGHRSWNVTQALIGLTAKDPSGPEFIDTPLAGPPHARIERVTKPAFWSMYPLTQQLSTITRLNAFPSRSAYFSIKMTKSWTYAPLGAWGFAPYNDCRVTRLIALTLSMEGIWRRYEHVYSPTRQKDRQRQIIIQLVKTHSK